MGRSQSLHRHEPVLHEPDEPARDNPLCARAAADGLVATVVDDDGGLRCFESGDVVDHDQVTPLGLDLLEGPPRVAPRLEGKGHEPPVSGCLAGEGGDHVGRGAEFERKPSPLAGNLSGLFADRFEVAGGRRRYHPVRGW